MTLVQKNDERMRKWMRMAAALQAERFTMTWALFVDRKVTWSID